MKELEYWLLQTKTARISRGEFMERAAAFGITAACANTLLSQAGVAATPKRGGSARFGLSHGATTDTGNPATYSDS